MAQQVEKSPLMIEDTAPIIAFAHDLRQPLRAIMMHAQRIQRQDSQLSAETRAKLEEILAAGRRQEELIASVVEYDEALRNGLSKEARMPLRLAIQTACMKVEAYRKLQNGIVRFDPAAGPEVVSPSAIAKVFEKILHNALKFHPKGVDPVVEVEVTPGTSGSTGIRITDNGLGIEPQYRSTVFEPFRRLNPAGEYSGSGMGLSTCRRLLESINGSILIEDHPHSQGSTIVVSLPLIGVAGS